MEFGNVRVKIFGFLSLLHFLCQQTIGDHNSYANTTDAIIDVPSITNFSCVLRKGYTDDNDKLTCTWSLEKCVSWDDIRVHINISTTGQKPYNIPCGTLVNKTSCSWFPSDCYINSFLLGYHMSVWNINVGVQEAREYSYTTFRWDIAKILPPTSVTAISNETCIKIEWSSTSDKVAYSYRISVSSEWNQTNFYEEGILNTSIICNLHPGTLHNVSISWKWKNGKIYSKEKVIQYRTKPSPPTEAPGVFPGAYSWQSQCLTQTRGNVVVFWERISKQSENGPLSHYEVEYIQDNGTVLCIGTSNFSLILNLACNRAYQINVKVFNKAGPSPCSQLLILPPKESRPPLEIVVEQNEVGDKATVSVFDDDWTSGPVTYILVWCLGRRASHLCQGELHHKEFTNNSVVTNMILGYALSETMIGVNKIKDGKGSGIRWQTCRYTNNTAPSKLQHVYAERSTESDQIIIYWKPSPCKVSSDNAFITTYRIIYCAEPSGYQCKEGTDQEVELSAVNSISKYIIKDARANLRYGVQVQAVSKTKIGPPSLMQLVGIKPNGMTIEGTTIIVVVVIVLLALFLLILCLKSRIKKWWHSFRKPYSITPPVFEKKISSTHTPSDAYTSGSVSCGNDFSEEEMLGGKNVQDQTLMRNLSDDSGRGSLPDISAIMEEDWLKDKGEKIK